MLNEVPILLAEDDEFVRALSARILRQHGYTVLESEGAREALEIAHSSRGSIDLLLAELNMPQMSGRELGQRFSELCPNAKVLYMSGNAENGAGEQTGSAAPGVFLQKPFTLEALTQLVRAILEQ